MRFETHEAAGHAIQSGIAMEFSTKYPQFGDDMNSALKHLRVGINCAMCDHASLVMLLVEKGIIEEEEYKNNVLEGLNKEVERLEAMLTEMLGGKTKITLA